MIGFTYDDGGRAESGRRGKAGDCVVRAAAILTGRPYDEIYRMAAQHMKERGYPRSARHGVWEKTFLPKLGLKRIKLIGCKPTFSEAHEQFGNCIVSTRKHVAALVDGQLRDTFDHREYEWDDGVVCGSFERKAMSVFVIA